MNNIPFWPEWTVEEKIGQGSYGRVYKIRKSGARNGRADIYSALKVLRIPTTDSEIHNLREQGMDDDSVRELLINDVNAIENEVRVMISLASAAGIVTIEDYYIEELRDQIGWNVYIRMELLESLTAYIERKGMLSKDEVLEMGCNVCDALKACESQNIIHRDIKPANIFRNKFGQFKLGDFGVAKQMEGTHSAATRIGTPSYEAPEVFFGQKYDRTVDIYGLGMVLYTCLNQGRKPFYPPYPDKLTRENMQEALQKRLSGKPVPPVPGMDQELYDIIEKACAFQPASRYQSAADLKSDLERYRSRRSEAAIKPRQSHHVQNIRFDEETTTQLWTRKKKSKIPFIAAGIFAALVLVVLGVLIGRLSDKSGKESEEKIAELTAMLTSKPAEESEPTSTVPPEPTNTVIPEPTNTVTPEPVNTVTSKPSNTVTSKQTITPTSVPTSTPTPLGTPIPNFSTALAENGSVDTFSEISEGDSIIFGTYEQDNNASNGKEGIEWIVLAREDEKALLISKYALDCRKYNDKYYFVTWETCSLRSWLNDAFVKTAFTEKERSRIPTVTIKNDANPKYKTEGGRDTRDQIFLLSIEEADQYFSTDKERICGLTEYAKAQGAYGSSQGKCWWWLRSPGNISLYAAIVNNVGSVRSSGTDITYGNDAVRPALWINM